MTKQPDSVLSLKAAFYDRYAARLSVRAGSGSMRGAYLVTLPKGKEYGRAELLDLARWLEARGFFAWGDTRFLGELSSPDGWTCWNGGRSVFVRLRE